jgi:arylsulfatase A-like enzyme
MKKLGVVVVLVAAGAWAWSQYWYYLPGLISDIVSPVGEFQEVTWQQGPAAAPTGEQPPNIILIVADDLGFNDITFYGGGIADGSVPTPNIDAIAAEGIHFTNGYTGNGTCSPSRAALLTGRFATRSGFEFTPASPAFMTGFESSDPMGLPSEELTLPEMLATGILPGAALFMAEDDPDVVNSYQDFDPIDRFLWANMRFAVRHNNGQRFAPDSHMTDYFSRHAVKVIEANRHRPFFLYLAYNAPHTPLQAERADYNALDHIENHTERTYAAMLRGLDRGIGQVLAALEDNGIAENTIVVFTSDNGGAGYVGLPDLNKPYRGWKITFFEGGIHTPYFIRWPDRIPAGSQYDAAVAHVDIFSTALAAAEVALPGDRVIDGVDVLDAALSEPEVTLSRPLFWRSGGYKVVLQDGWKLQFQEQTGQTWLFDLNEDPTEREELSATRPEKLAALKTVLDRLDSEMAEPLWPSLMDANIAVDYTLDKVPDEPHETVIWSN